MKGWCSFASSQTSPHRRRESRWRCVWFDDAHVIRVCLALLSLPSLRRFKCSEFPSLVSSQKNCAVDSLSNSFSSFRTHVHNFHSSPTMSLSLAFLRTCRVVVSRKLHQQPPRIAGPWIKNIFLDLHGILWKIGWVNGGWALSQSTSNIHVSPWRGRWCTAIWILNYFLDVKLRMYGWSEWSARRNLQQVSPMFYSQPFTNILRLNAFKKALAHHRCLKGYGGGAVVAQTLDWNRRKCLCQRGWYCVQRVMFAFAVGILTTKFL